MWKDLKAPQNFLKKITRLSLPRLLLLLPSSDVSASSAFFFILVLHFLHLLRSSSSSRCLFFPSEVFFAFLLPHLRCRHCCRDQVESFFFALLLLLQVSASSSRYVSPSHFFFFFVVGDGGNRHREVAGQFTNHLIRKPLTDQVDPEQAYGSWSVRVLRIRWSVNTKKQFTDHLIRKSNSFILIRFACLILFLVVSIVLNLNIVITNNAPPLISFFWLFLGHIRKKSCPG